MKKIGLIGTGNMGTAILEGLFRKRLAKPSQVWVYDALPAKAKAFARRWKTHAARNLPELLKAADVIILAFKPQDLVAAGPMLRSNWKSRHTGISILAGTPLVKLRRFLGSQGKWVRAMPNLGAKVGASVTALTGDRQALKTAEQIFSGCGQTVRLKERDFDLVTAVSGSGPAYYFLLMEMLIAAARQEGLPEKAARMLAVQTAVGAGLLAQQSADAPGELRRQVTSKKGTTEAALKVFEAGRFGALVKRAVRAAMRRGRELSRAA